MSSLPLPTPIFSTDAAAVLAQAIGDVAERSFFAFVEPCDEARFAELADGATRWYTASVRFDEGAVGGVVECALPDDLVGMLFDAFSGRDISDPAPEPAAVDDLIGEFGNMVCGAWLTRAANDQTFTLRAPDVAVSERGLPPLTEHTLTVAINDRPVAVTVRVVSPLSTAGAA